MRAAIAIACFVIAAALAVLAFLVDRNGLK